MRIEPSETGLGQTVTFVGAQELGAVSIGLLVFEQFHENIAVSALLNLMEIEDTSLTADADTFSLTNSFLHEQYLLRGLGWVARERERLSVAMFAATADLNAVERAFALFDEAAFGEHFEVLSGLVEQLYESGVIEPNDNL